MNKKIKSDLLCKYRIFTLSDFFKPESLHNLGRTKAGFSLVEVMMALGILSFAMITILGLLTAGLSGLHKSIDVNVQTQITQSIMGAVRQTDFSLLPDLDGTIRYYDDQGNEVLSTSDISAKRYIYSAEITIKDETYVPAAPAPVSSSTLVTVQACIINRTMPSRSFEFSTWVADNGL